MFERIDGIGKVMNHEEEITEFQIVEGTRKEGAATIGIEIFGTDLDGKMRYRLSDRKAVAVVDSPDVEKLEFGYTVQPIDGGSRTTQFVEFDTGSRLTNLLVKWFLRGRIKEHMAAEVEDVVDPSGS